MTAYIFFHIKYDELDKYSNAEIFHSANNWTTPILLKNYDFSLEDKDDNKEEIEDEDKDYYNTKWMFYKVNTTNNISFKIKLGNEYILLTDSNYLTVNDKNMISITENTLSNGILNLRILFNMIKIYRIYEDRPLNTLFEGEFKDDHFNGKGIMYDAGYKKYEGHFKDGMYNGQGILYYEDSHSGRTGNTLYEGELKEGTYNGKGIEYYRDGGVKYDGMWKDGKYNGHGIKYYNYIKGGNIEYEGMWEDGKYNGKGILYYENGNKWYREVPNLRRPLKGVS